MLVDYVDTKIGVIGTRASNYVLGPQMPFGCINPSPQSAKGSTPGYNPKMPKKGYGQLHVRVQAVTAVKAISWYLRKQALP